MKAVTVTGSAGVKEFTTPSGTFRVECKLGCGTYGTVFKVRKTEDPTIVKALKTFDPETMDKMEGIPPTTIRELNALKAMRPHPNVIQIDEVVYPENGDIEQIFYTMELCQGSLKDKHLDMINTWLVSNDDWTSLASKSLLPAGYIKEAKLIIWQLMNGVAYSHSWGIAHRDLKPANIMWDFTDGIKVGDYGLARFVRGNSNSAGDDGIAPQTGEVQTLWYRAPEVLLGEDRYGAIVDDWSIGCIMAEFFRLKKVRNIRSDPATRPIKKAAPPSQCRWEPDPLFRGDSETQTLMMVLEARGTPAKGTSEYDYVSSLPYWSDRLPFIETALLPDRVPVLDEVGLDLLCRLLCLHPGKRTASRFLLDHPWFMDVGETIRTRYKLWNDDPAVRSMYTILAEARHLPGAEVMLPPGRRTDGNIGENGEKLTKPSSKADPANKTGGNANRSRSPDRRVVAAKAVVRKPSAKRAASRTKTAAG